MIALLAIAVIGPEGWLLVLVIGLTHAPRTARVARQATVAVAGQDYIRAAEMYAVPRQRILLREILPQVRAVPVVSGCNALARVVARA